MGQQTYNMGQIIYILSSKSQSVVPAIVDEQVVRKIRKADGVHEVINYKLCVGPKDRQQIVDLTRIDGEVFESLEEIRKTLIERLTSFVDGVVKETRKNVSSWYGINPESSLDDIMQENMSAEGKLDPGQLIHAVNNNLAIGNSSSSSYHPLQYSAPSQQGPMINPHSSIRDNIRAMVEEPDDGMQGLGITANNQGTQMVILEDGTKVPVKIN